jgi:hypothetical protein
MNGFYENEVLEKIESANGGKVQQLNDTGRGGKDNPGRNLAPGMDESGLPETLLGSSPPAVEVKTERFYHRIAVYMAAQGARPLEVANHLRLTPQTVYNLFRQPWFQKEVNALLNANGKEGVEKLIASATPDAVWTLIDIMRDEKAPKNVRSANAARLIEQFLGKPTQKLEVSEGPKVDDLNQLEEELARTREELKAVEPFLASKS